MEKVLNNIKECTSQKRIQIIKSNGKTMLLVNGQPYMNWTIGDEISERMAIVQLYELSLGTQGELAEVFQVHVNSISKYVATFKAGGCNGLRNEGRGPKQSWKLKPNIRAKILVAVLKEGIEEYAAIQKRLEKKWNQKVSIESIRQVLLENGLIEKKIKPSVEQEELFRDTKDGQLNLELFEKQQTEEKTLPPQAGGCKQEKLLEKINLNKPLTLQDSVDSCPEGGDKNRSHYSQAERIYLDQLEQGQFSAYAGGLLFTSLLERHHFREIIKQIIDIETYEGYTLEQLCLTLFYFDLFGYRSIEDFKMVYPEEFGVLLGKVTSPSIYTLRRFLHRVRKLKKGEDLTKEFGKEYLKSGLVNWEALYIDGHFVPYYGEQIITKGWHGVRAKAMKGSYQFFAIDEKFNPLIFLVRPSSDDLLEIIPEIIEDTRRLGQEVNGQANDLTIIFDREGYSAELFRKLNEMKPKVKFITWAKYADRWVGNYNPEQFNKSVAVKYEIQTSEEVKYFDTNRTMNKYGKIRTIVIESGRKKKRSAIYTNDDDADAGRIIQFICRRWGQETLNKTFKLDHRMDYFPGYVAEELGEQPLVENPKVEDIKKQKASLVSKLNNLRIKFAKTAFAEAKDATNWKEIKDRNRDLCVEIDIINARIALLDIRIDDFPQKVSFAEAHDGEKLMEFDYEKKQFLDCIKIFVYMMQKRMCGILGRYYDNPKDIYSILAMIVRRGGDIKLEEGKLKVRLKGFRNPLVNYAARHLCEDLNHMELFTLDKFRLPLCYQVA